MRLVTQQAGIGQRPLQKIRRIGKSGHGRIRLGQVENRIAARSLFGEQPGERVFRRAPVKARGEHTASLLDSGPYPASLVRRNVAARLTGTRSVGRAAMLARAVLMGTGAGLAA